MNGYHSLKLSILDGMPRLALPCPWLMIPSRPSLAHQHDASSDDKWLLKRVEYILQPRTFYLGSIKLFIILYS